MARKTKLLRWRLWWKRYTGQPANLFEDWSDKAQISKIAYLAGYRAGRRKR